MAGISAVGLVGCGGPVAATSASSVPNVPSVASERSDAPEVADVKIGIIALTDCSPFVVAAEKGLFKKYVINATINKGASWAAIRDNLINGDIHATHLLLGMPFAFTMG